jgi:hypothetical protein
VVSIRVTGADLAVEVRATGREPGEALTVAVLHQGPAGSVPAPLARAATQAGADGVAAATIGPVPVGDTRVEVRVAAGDFRCTATVTPTDPTPPAITCPDR